MWSRFKKKEVLIEQGQERYLSYRWRFRNAGGLVILIYAREENVALKIIAIENTETDQPFIPARRGYKKPCYVLMPPYELEMAEMETATKRLAHRREYLKTHKQ